MIHPRVSLSRGIVASIREGAAEGQIFRRDLLCVPVHFHPSFEENKDNECVEPDLYRKLRWMKMPPG